MKKAQTCIAILIIASVYPLSSNAQLFKTLENLAKTSSAKTVNAKDSAALIKPKNDNLQSMMSGMKTDMPGGASVPSQITVSAADSAAAIKSFMQGNGGSGIVFQYFTSTSSKKSGIIKDTMSTFVTASGSSRVEMSSDMIIISHSTQQSHYKYGLWLYPSYKTYTLNILDTSSSLASDKTTYQVTKIGNETVEGYNCIHSKLTITTNRTSITEDVWTSTDVPGYSHFKKMMDEQKSVTPKMLLAMEQAGCIGFIVKLTVQNQNFSMTMLLANIAQKNLPASLFQIPPGYTHAAGNNLMYQMMKGASK